MTSERLGAPTLSRELILERAVELADLAGIDSLSMRRLAQDLDVGAMSLYYYFASKEALLGAMLDSVFGEMETVIEDGDWRSALRAHAVTAHQTLLRHSWACELIGKPSPSPSRSQLRRMNAILGRLRNGGFTAEMTHHAYHALEAHIVGFTMWVLPYIAISRNQPDFAERVLEEVPMSDLPHLVEHIAYHMDHEQQGDTSEFDFGLELLLDGLERLRQGEQ
jgi:AcrR family transcriptional regulator